MGRSGRLTGWLWRILFENSRYFDEDKTALQYQYGSFASRQISIAERDYLLGTVNKMICERERMFAMLQSSVS